MVEQPARAALIGSRWPHPEGEWAMPPSASSASEPANVAAATVPMRSASDLSGVPKNRWVEAMDVNREGYVSSPNLKSPCGGTHLNEMGTARIIRRSVFRDRPLS